MNEKEKIKELIITISHLPSLTRELKKNGVFDFVMAETKSFSDLTMIERCIIIINDLSPICEISNKKRRWISKNQTYGFCGSNNVCECSKKSYAEKMAEWHKEYPEEKKQEVRKKIKETNLKKYGVEYGLSSHEIQDKIKQTNIEKYGVDRPLQNSEFFNKAKQTTLNNYGVEYPLQNLEVFDKTKQTNVKKYGVENPLQNSEIQNKRKKTNVGKYGVENHTQKHLSKETIEILNDKYLFIEKYKDRHDYVVCAEELGIHDSTFLKYRKKYGLIINYNRSSYEFDLENFLIEYNINFEISNRQLIYPLELDFYLPNYNLAIEINGLYWHSEQMKGKYYHKKKYELCKQQNIRLLMVNEDEWVHRKNSIKQKILNLVGKSEKGIGARKLNINPIKNNIAIDFCEKYHIQGGTPNTKYSYGAFDNEKLVSVICIGLVRNTNVFNLSRFCTDGKLYAGVFSRLFKFYLNDQNPEEVITFADLRYSDGGLYEKTGFIFEKINVPDYTYINKNKTYDKQNFTKAKLKKKYPEIYSDDKTEYQMMTELGFDRIWDCGKIRYRFKNKILGS